MSKFNTSDRSDEFPVGIGSPKSPDIFVGDRVKFPVDATSGLPSSYWLKESVA